MDNRETPRVVGWDSGNRCMLRIRASRCRVVNELFALHFSVSLRKACLDLDNDGRISAADVVLLTRSMKRATGW